ncbi:MAG: DUF5011 domain-containing protein [Verrucomicrobia bacterium]|nr:DUF5011 domain-containing protein [Verrucomicrobiota bacterium]
MWSLLGPSWGGTVYWMGGTDQGSDGNWRWVTGENWSFNRWYPSEPSGGGEHQLLSSGNLPDGQPGWNDGFGMYQPGNFGGYILEFGYPTDPTKADTDGDGFDDKAETLAGTDPNNPASHVLNPNGDEDGDGLTNGQELTLGTDPRNKDTDSDGVNDPVEIADGTNPNDPSSYSRLNKGLVAYYPFNGNANDESGSGNHCAVVNATLAPDRFGHPNSAYHFNGISSLSQGSYLTTSSHNNLPTGKSDLTVNLWASVQQPIEGDWRVIFANKQFDNFQLGLGTDLYNTKRIQYHSSSAYPQISTDQLVWNDSQWYMITLTLKDGLVSFFRDGEMLASFNLTSYGYGNYGSGDSLNLTFGGRQDPPSTLDHPWLGNLDGIRIYNRALSNVEVGQLYQNEAGTLDTDGDGLTDAWERGYGRYQVVPGNFTWEQAKANAESRKADLNPEYSAYLAALRALEAAKAAATAEKDRTQAELSAAQAALAAAQAALAAAQAALANAESVKSANAGSAAAAAGGKNIGDDMAYAASLAAANIATADVAAKQASVQAAAAASAAANANAAAAAAAYAAAQQTVAQSGEVVGHLATITSANEWTSVSSILSAELLGAGVQGDLWLGAGDFIQEGRWEWVTGEPWSYTRWRSPYPDNAGGNEDHLELEARFPDYLWNDEGHADFGQGYILEFGYPTDPTRADTDGDGVNDKAETLAGTDPNDAQKFPTASSGNAYASVFRDFDAKLEPGVWHGWMLAPTSTNCAYLAKVTPLPHETGSALIDKVVIQSEWNGTAWYDVLRIAAPANQGQDLDVRVRVFKISGNSGTTPNDAAVIRSHAAFAANLDPGIWHGWVLGSTRTDAAYLVKVTPDSGAINRSVLLEKVVVQSEYNGSIWQDVLRIMSPTNQATLPVQVRVFQVAPRQPDDNPATLASISQIRSMTANFDPGIWHGYALAQASPDRAYVSKITPLPSEILAPPLEKVVFQSEWNGSVWNDVLRVMSPSSSATWSGHISVFEVMPALTDIEAPVITLIGADPLEIYKGATFTDPGATVTDNKDSTRTVTGSGTVDTSAVGIYTLTYTATDVAGNLALPVTRTVNVVLDPAADEDGDGLTNGTEISGGTNPYQRDSDGDGVNDPVEIADGTNPTDASSYNSLNRGLVAYYPFNGNANDASGNGNHGTVNGATLTTDRSGTINQAYSFGGENRIVVPHNPSLGPNQGSVCFWVKANSWATTDGLADLIGKDNHTDRQWVVQMFSDGRIRSAVFTTTGLNYADSTTLYPVNTWHQIVMAWDGSNLRTYVNGVQSTVVACTGSLATGTNSVSIGGSSAQGWGSSIDGKMDEIRIYNRALSAAEVSQIYQAEPGNLGGQAFLAYSEWGNGDIKAVNKNGLSSKIATTAGVQNGAMVADNDGNLYICDSPNKQILKVSLSSGETSVYASGVWRLIKTRIFM